MISKSCSRKNGIPRSAFEVWTVFSIAAVRVVTVFVTPFWSSFMPSGSLESVEFSCGLID